jgi:hypothetical protein
MDRALSFRTKWVIFRVATLQILNESTKWVKFRVETLQLLNDFF